MVWQASAETRKRLETVMVVRNFITLYPSNQSINRSIAHKQIITSSKTTNNQIHLSKESQSNPNHPSPTYTYLILFATTINVNVMSAIKPTIPPHIYNPSTFSPGTWTFIPKSPAIKFNGTKIVAKTVIRESKSLAREPCSIWFREIWERWLEWLRLSIFS